MSRSKFVVGVVSLHENVLKQKVIVASSAEEALVQEVGEDYKGMSVEDIQAAAFEADYVVGVLELPA